jgi:hypothetical protein
MMKKSFFLLKIIGCLVLIYPINACKESCKAEPEPPLSTTSLYFYLVDKNTGQKLVPLRFTPENIKLFDDKLLDLNLKKNKESDNSFAFGPFYFYQEPEDNISSDKIVEKTYYLYLGNQDYDTLRVSFETNKTKCERVFKDLKFFYNNQNIQNPREFYNPLINLKKKI